MKIIKPILILICATFVVSCNSTTYDEISVPVTNPTYTTNIEPIIKANCTSCHSDSQYPNLTNYSEVKDATQNGSLICRIDQSQSCGGVMPQGGAMPKHAIDLIILWNTQGCIN